ncbi:hypothetical protein LLH03_01135 [bacterium]|nr:hypothetical protein [bacterium]
MAQFRVTEKARQHIVERICERLLCKGLPSDQTTACCGSSETQGEAEGLLDEALAALEDQTPVGWRFTQHPSACFFVSLVHQCQLAGTGQVCSDHVKLLGVTVRESHDGRVLREQVDQYALQALAAGECQTGAVPEWCEGNAAALREMSKLYLRDLERADSEIVHELRTAYAPAEDIAQRRHSNDVVLSAHPHTMILRSMRVTSTRAAMPNALLWRGDGEGGCGLRLWVRQGTRWSKATQNGRQAPMYSLFCPMTSHGPSFGDARIWSFNSQGVLRCLEPAQLQGAAGAVWSKPDDYHTESYWALPTRLDVLHMDLDYLIREQAHRVTARDVALWHVVEQVYQLAFASLGLAAAPAWSRKTKEAER